MGVSLGAAGGIGQGLLQGVQAYMQTQNMLQEQAVKQKLANAQSIDAMSKLYSSAGNNADTNGLLKQYGLPTVGNNEPAAPSQSTAQGSVTPDRSPAQGGVAPAQPLRPVQSPPQGSPSSGYSPTMGSMQPSQSNSLQSAQEEYNAAAKRVMSEPEHRREGILAPYAAKLKAAAELETEQGKLANKKSKIDINNASMEPYFKMKTEFDHDETVKAANDVALNLKKVISSSASNTSPDALNGLISNYARIENPGKAITEYDIKHFQNNPNISQGLADKISRWTSGTPTTETINDIKRAASAAASGAFDRFQEVQNRYKNIASKKGIDPSFSEDEGITGLTKASAKMLEDLGPYKSTLQVATESGPGKSLKDAFKTLAKGLLPGQSDSLNAGEIDPKIDAMAKASGVDYQTAKAVFDKRSAALKGNHGGR